MTTIETTDIAGRNGDTGAKDPLLVVRNLVQEFVLRDHGGVKGGVVKAVSDVSFEIRHGETLGLVGETGSGKSTVARSILQIPGPKSGTVEFKGTDLTQLRRGEYREALRRIQMVFQDPYSSMHPKWRVWDIVEEPLVGHKIGSRESRRRRADEVLELVGLSSAYGTYRPRQLSGGQCQRVAIARALALSPSLIICDEAVSALDVVIQAQVLGLLETLRQELDLSYLFIAHDLAIVRQVSDRVAVMYLGKLCEIGPTEALYRAPGHPYTQALLASIPSLDPGEERVSTDDVISGELPSPIDPPSGCRFRTRCPRAQEICALEEPPLRPLRGDDLVACHFPLEDPGEA